MLVECITVVSPAMAMQRSTRCNKRSLPRIDLAMIVLVRGVLPSMEMLLRWDHGAMTASEDGCTSMHGTLHLKSGRR